MAVTGRHPLDTFSDHFWNVCGRLLGDFFKARPGLSGVSLLSLIGAHWNLMLQFPLQGRKLCAYFHLELTGAVSTAQWKNHGK
jgi:hypothetical protein